MLLSINILTDNKDINTGEQAINLIMIAKYLERIGDHAQNVAEWVLYAIIGDHRKIKEYRGD